MVVEVPASDKGDVKLNMVNRRHPETLHQQGQEWELREKRSNTGLIAGSKVHLSLSKALWRS
jgi:hypothetical protein